MPIRSFIEEYVGEKEAVVLISGKTRKKTTGSAILSNGILSDRNCKIGMVSGLLAIYVV